MDTISSGGQLWPLKSASGENPTLTPGQPTTFQCNDLPDRSPTGPLAYYLTAVLLTIYGTFTPASEGGVGITREDLVRCLIDSLDWTNSWFGAVLSKQYVQGAFLQPIEFTAGGFRYGQRQMPALADSGAQNFAIMFALPACNDKRGRLVRDTSQLALLFQSSQLKVNVAASSVLSGVSAGSTLSNLSARASAVLIPRQEIVLGTPMEWVLHEIAVGGSAVKITGFGRDTALTGTQAKGGVSFLGELTSSIGQGGSFAALNVTELQFQWRGQGQLYDIPAWVNMLMGGLPNDRPQMSDTTVNGTADRINDYMGYPYLQNYAAATASVIDLQALRFLPLVVGGDDLNLSQLQTAQTDETYYKTVTGGESGTHRILAQYARAWQAPKIGDWVGQVKSGGPNSLAAYVLGGHAANAKPQQRLPRDAHSLFEDQKTYLPWQLI